MIFAIRRSLAPLIGVIVVLSACSGPLSPAPPTVHRVGYLSTGADTGTQIIVQVLGEIGYVEGRNLRLAFRSDDGHPERDPDLAAELVSLKPDVILVRGIAQALALKQATSTIPIVMVGTRNPVESGIVPGLARPGGNVTGVTISGGDEAAQRRLQLLKEVAPGAVRIGWLFDPSNRSGVWEYEQGRHAAAALEVELLPLMARSPEDVADALAAATRGHADAMVTAPGPITTTQQSRILDFLATYRLPAMTFNGPQFVDGGALMYYDANRLELFRRAASYVDRILKGAKPADLPIETPTKFDFIINLRTAKALGLTIPPSVLAQATELIR